MTTEIAMLLYALLLLFATIMVQVMNGVRVFGMAKMSGMRADIPPSVEVPGFQGRVGRTIANQIESLMLFAPLVLIAHQLGISTPTTIAGAQVYLIGRLIHTGCYFFGISYLRTLAFLVALAGTAMIFLAIVGLG